MNNTLKTEEFQTKKSYKGLIIILLVLIILGVGGYYLYSSINTKKKATKKTKQEEVTSLNSELQDIYGFAITNNYITALKQNGTNIKIYNLLQGTGNLGDFTYYAYHNDKLYLLFSDNSLYTISLTAGNKIYELTRSYTFDTITCNNGHSQKTSDLAFTTNSIYLNTSSCGINQLSYSPKTKKTNIKTIKTFNNPGVDLEYSKTDNSLYIKADNSIIKLNMKNGEQTQIATNINTTTPIVLKSNILIYSHQNNNQKAYYGYNIKTNKNTQLVENASDLILYQNSFIYYTNEGVYLLSNNKSKLIYKVHYNNLSNMQLINKTTLQIVDSDINDKEKKRIINIDLSSKKYITKQNKEEFTNVVEYTK